MMQQNHGTEGATPFDPSRSEIARELVRSASALRALPSRQLPQAKTTDDAEVRERKQAAASEYMDELMALADDVIDHCTALLKELPLGIGTAIRELVRRHTTSWGREHDPFDDELLATVIDEALAIGDAENSSTNSMKSGGSDTTFDHTDIPADCPKPVADLIRRLYDVWDRSIKWTAAHRLLMEACKLGDAGAIATRTAAVQLRHQELVQAIDAADGAIKGTDRFIRPFTDTKPGAYATRVRKLLREFRPFVTIGGYEPGDNLGWRRDYASFQSQLTEIRVELKSFAYSEVGFDDMHQVPELNEEAYQPPSIMEVWTNPPQWLEFDLVMKMYRHHREAFFAQRQARDAQRWGDKPPSPLERTNFRPDLLVDSYRDMVVPFGVYLNRQLDRVATTFPGQAANVATLRQVVGDPVSVPDAKGWDESESTIRRSEDLIRTVWRDSGKRIPLGAMIPVEDHAGSTLVVGEQAWDWQWAKEPPASEKKQEDVPSSGPLWSVPLSKTEIARRYTQDPRARWRKVKDTIEQHGIEPRGNQWVVCMDRMPKSEQDRLNNPLRR